MKTATSMILASGSVLLLLGSLCLCAPLPPGERPQEKVILSGHTNLIGALAFSPNGQTLVSASADGTVRLWDVTNGKNTATFQHPTAPGDIVPRVYAVAVSPDGKTVASSGKDRTIKLWDVISGINTENYAIHGITEQLAFSPDGKKLVSTGMRIILDLETKKERAILENARSFSSAITAFSPEGKLLVASIDYGVSGDMTSISVWDGDNSKKITTCQGHTAVVKALAFTPDRKLLASTSWDGTVKLWDVETGKNLMTFNEIPAQRAGLGGLAFSPDGKVLACGYLYQGVDGRKPRRGAIRLYETATGKVLATLKGSDPGPCNRIVFSPNGKLLAAGCADKYNIAIWSLPRRYAADE